MNLYKFINEYKIEKYKGGFVILNNMIHTNPKEETLIAVGYKPLETVIDPEYDVDTQYIEITYSDEGEYIQQIKTIKNIEELEEENIEEESEPNNENIII